MSIVRVGLAETKNFAEGYEAIFGKKKAPAKKDKPAARSASKTEAPVGKTKTPRVTKPAAKVKTPAKATTKTVTKDEQPEAKSTTPRKAKKTTKKK